MPEKLSSESRLPASQPRRGRFWLYIALFIVFVVYSLLGIAPESDLMPESVLEPALISPFHVDSNSTRFSLEKLQHKAYSLVSKPSIGQAVGKYFSEPHLAGQNMALVNYTAGSLNSSGFETEVERFDVLLNYPVRTAVRIPSLDLDLDLEEQELEEDSTTLRKDRIPVFHGYSANGTAKGELVYANYGRVEDFEHLKSQGISVKGKIVLCRYSKVFRGIKVKNAELNGAVGVLIYSDIDEDGEITVENGYKAYPHGPARNPSSVQRGSVQDLPFGPGDPTTPGYASVPGVNRTDPQHIPSIVSIPISYENGQILKKSLGEEIEVTNIQDYAIRPIYNVLGELKGESNDVVLVGNHRDSWIIGGADPNSGSAVLLEAARVLGELQKQGWKPKRTIKFASWDAEEYGLVGSTEHGELHHSEITKHTVSYLNVDLAVAGSQFELSGNPLLRPVVDQALDFVKHNGTTMGKYWGADPWTRIGPLGGGSDYAVFQQHLGIPSIDFGFVRGSEDPIYHYHSNYDSVHWMKHFGDPVLDKHVAMVRMLLHMILDISEPELLPFATKAYAQRLSDALPSLNAPLDSSKIYRSVNELNDKAEEFDSEVVAIGKQWKELEDKKGFWNGVKRLVLWAKIGKINSKLQSLDQEMLCEGLDGREWFKHIVYAPERNAGYAAQVYPGIYESIEDGDDENLQKWIDLTTEGFQRVIDHL